MKADCPSCGKKNIEPVKSWNLTGKGGVKIITHQYKCPQCSHSWRAWERG